MPSACLLLSTQNSLLNQLTEFQEMCYEHHGTGRDFSAIWLYNASTTCEVQGWIIKMQKYLL
jgi:hypothetical protein